MKPDFASSILPIKEKDRWSPPPAYIDQPKDDPFPQRPDDDPPIPIDPNDKPSQNAGV